MIFQWHTIFILLSAVSINCTPNNTSKQKSEATRAIQDAKAKISKSSAKFGQTSFKSYLPPAQPVSMKKIGSQLKSSKPKTFAFSSNSFSFRAPVFSQTNLQLGTKEGQKLPSKEVFAKQDIQHYKPHTNKILKKVLVGNKKQGPRKTIIKKIIIRRKIKVKPSSETQKEHTTKPAKLGIITSTQTISTGKEVTPEKRDSMVDKTWVKNITRSDAVQRPIMKEPTPKKKQPAKIGFEPAPQMMTVSSSYRIPFHKFQAAPPLKKKEQNLSTQREVTRNLVINTGNDVGLTSDMKSEAKMNIRANTIISVTKNSDLTKLDEKKTIVEPPIVSERITTDFQIPLPPGEIFENGSLFMNLPRKEFQHPAQKVVNSKTNDRDVVLGTPPSKHKSLFDKFQSVQRNREMAKSDIIPPDLQHVITVKQQHSKDMVKKPLETVPLANDIGLSSGSIQKMREPSQATGVSVGVSLSETFNQHPPSPGHLRPGFIPPPPPNGFRRQHIPKPPGPWIVPTPPLITPPNRIHSQTSPLRSNQNTLNHGAQMNYIQTKVPLSGVIPQPPIVARKHSRFSRPKNIAPYPQHPADYLTKAPNKQNQVPLSAPGQGQFDSMHINHPRNRHHGGPHLNRDFMRKPPKPPTQNFVDPTVSPVVNKPEPRPRRRNLPRPVQFDPLKHIMKRKQELTKKAKKPTNIRTPPEPPGEKKASPDPDRKKMNQKIFKNSFQKDYVNERRSRQPMKEFVSEFERFMKHMDSFMDLAGMLEF
ncbi:serine/arginine repetitive matrix protein 1-like [Saccostrea echinata]|uniref:serine/arginine repetitive matrix protein 1-like n=1 Tax=Saccostrea echinata TaxID=191078 RepID=UPI002A82BDA4|nr:serine/arginine repetitive matrix protein 1-like [Saccostrea echinata]